MSVSLRPADPSAFRRLVGRDTELAELLRLLAAEPVVLVTGPPGIGKSALAGELQAAWVDVGEEETLLAALVRALDVPVARAEAVVGAARSVDVVVVDGADRVADDVSELVELLRSVTRVVVTCRRRLELDAAVLELGPLPRDDAAELLRRRMRCVLRGRALDAVEVQGLADAVDGVPLALELLAPRLRLRSPAELIARPTDGLDPLLDAVRDAVDSCAPAAREVLLHAAVLRCPFDASLLGAICGREVDEDLLALLDASLVHPLPGPVPRFCLLAPVRAALVPSAEVGAAVLDRLAAVALPVAEAAVAQLERDSMGALARDVPWMEQLLDHEDPAVRLRSALVLAGREIRTGPLAATLARDQHLGDEGPAELRVAWADALATAASHFGRHREAIEAVDRVRGLVDQAELPRWRAQRAVVLVYGGRVPEGLSEAAAVEAVDDPVVQLRVGIARFYAGDLDGAVEPLRRARDAAPTPFRRAQAAIALAAALRDRGEAADRVAAELSLDASARIVERLPWIAPRAAFVRGVVAADRGDLDTARRELADSAAGMRVLGEGEQAVSVDATRLSLDLIDRDDVPRTDAPLDLSTHEQATWGAWHAVFLAARGERHGALAVASPSLQALRRFGDRSAPELAALIAVALGAELAAPVLAEWPEGHPMIALARAVLSGGEARLEARMEHRVLAALARRHPSRARVSPDGSAFVTDRHPWPPGPPPRAGGPRRRSRCAGGRRHLRRGLAGGAARRRQRNPARARRDLHPPGSGLALGAPHRHAVGWLDRLGAGRCEGRGTLSAL